MPTRGPCSRRRSCHSLALVSEVAARTTRPRAGRARRQSSQVVAVGVDVAHLAARPQVLAVEVHPQPRVAGQGVRVAVVQPPPACRRGPPRMLTITVHGARAAGEPSGRSRTARRWFSNWQVTAPSWLQWPVLCGRIASSLTRIRPSRVSKSSTARTPVTSSSPAIGQRDLAAPASASAGVEVGRGGDHLVADAVELGGLRRRGTPPPGRSASGPPAPTARGGSRPAPRRGSRTARALPPRPRTPARSPRPTATTQTPLPSYPPRVVLRTHGKPNASTSAGVGDDSVARARDAEPGEPRAHHRLVLRVHEGLRAGAHGDTARLERVQVLGRHVLVVEGDHRAALATVCRVARSR